MDHVRPEELLQQALSAAEAKANLSTRDLLTRRFLAGAILAYAASLQIPAPLAGADVDSQSALAQESA